MTMQVDYTANGTTSVFPFPFAIDGQDDCQVLLDGIIQAGDYSVRGQASIDGGAVVFDNPPAAGQTVTLRHRGTVTVTALDAAPGQLADKLLAGAGVSLETVTDPDGFQRLRIDGGGITGEVRMFAASTAPSGWLLCDGGAVSRTTYAALFATIGTVFGNGDGATTFNLPDLRGRAPIGVGQGIGLSDRSLGQKVGEEAHVLTVAELPSHDHSFTWTTSVEVGFDSPTGGVSGEIGGTIITSATGGGGAHNVMQPSLVLTFIIKA
ncbi:MAG: tail fiber protein [Magnetospirillum sp.]|nr:tail fiber protein [Magnetospirillum sp.]